jgi:tungstate transport system ATP-binding protein
MLERALPFEAAQATAVVTPILPLETRGLTFEAGGRRLLAGIDLKLRPGVRTVVMGPNGAGKSLLLRLLHGLLEPTAGTIAWHGRPAEDATRRRQAMVFQRPVLLRRSALGNLQHALRSRGLARREQRRRAEDALDKAQLTASAHTPARLLSGGEQQRLALARALSLAPEVLFLDEPTANLDPASTVAIERLIQDAHEHGTKVVLVTHDAGQARRLADEIVFLCDGRLEDHAPAQHFFDAPGSPRARAFLEGRIVI